MTKLSKTEVTRNWRPYKYVIKKPISLKTREIANQQKTQNSRMKKIKLIETVFIYHIHQQGERRTSFFLCDQQIDRFHRQKNLIKFRAIFL